MPASRGQRALLAWAVLLAFVAAACGARSVIVRSQQIAEGNPELGRALLEVKGCGSCHTIPGVPGADALVGPPLTHWGERTYIAGSLTNNQENLVRWIMNPQDVEPGTAMPAIPMTEEEALNMSAYLLGID